MKEKIEISGSPSGTGLHIRTPGTYAMGVAVDILKFLDEKTDISVKNTGWKEGYGLVVCDWIPIKTHDFTAELQTEGDELIIRKSSGSSVEFEEFFNNIVEYVNEENA